MKNLINISIAILSLGFLSNKYIENKLQKKLNDSNYAQNISINFKYKQFIVIPLFITAVLFNIGLFFINYILFCSILGSWFTYLSFVIALLFCIFTPICLSILINDVINKSIKVIQILNEPKTKNDYYFYDKYERGILND